jgi:putative nucleotidyltransferase with HDIG domain
MGGLPGTWLSYSAGGLVASAVSFYSIVFPAAHYTSYFSPLAILYIVTTTALSGAIGIFYRYLRDLSHDLLKNQEKIQKIFLDLVLSLSYALESADPYTKGHSEKVCIYARKLGEFLGLPGEQLDELEKAALLHDIGKMGISKLILNKPSKLTDDEYAIIKTHSEIGARTLELVMTLSPLAPIIKAHHESFDGLGYPERIMKEEIPLYARIIAIADSYDAMISNRAYRKGLSHDMAIEELRRCAGTQFDPQLVEAFIKSME